MSDYRMVFVVGSGRSGTTIMGRSLQLHSECTGVPFEPQLFAQSTGNNGMYVLLSEMAERKSLRITRMAKYLREQLDQERIDAFDLPPERNFNVLLDEFLEKVGPEGALPVEENRKIVRAFFDELYAQRVAKDGARVVIDDTPYFGRYIPELLELFPDAKFVHMYRDGISVANSYLEKGWKNNFTHAIQLWYELFDLTRRLGRGFAKDQYMEINLNALSMDPETHFNKVQEFMGVSTIENLHKDFRPTSADRRIEATRSQTEKLEYFRKAFPDYYDEFYG